LLVWLQLNYESTYVDSNIVVLELFH